jgi:hypothetical protein
MVRFECPSCGALGRAPDGKHARCRACGEQFLVVAAAPPATDRSAPARRPGPGRFLPWAAAAVLLGGLLLGAGLLIGLGSRGAEEGKPKGQPSEPKEPAADKEYRALLDQSNRLWQAIEKKLDGAMESARIRDEVLSLLDRYVDSLQLAELLCERSPSMTNRDRKLLDTRNARAGADRLRRSLLGLSPGP